MVTKKITLNELRILVKQIIKENDDEYGERIDYSTNYRKDNFKPKHPEDDYFYSEESYVEDVFGVGKYGGFRNEIDNYLFSESEIRIKKGNDEIKTYKIKNIKLPKGLYGSFSEYGYYVDFLIQDPNNSTILYSNIEEANKIIVNKLSNIIGKYISNPEYEVILVLHPNDVEIKNNIMSFNPGY